MTQELEKIYHVERAKYDMLMADRKRINDAVDRQHDRVIKARDDLRKQEKQND